MKFFCRAALLCAGIATAPAFADVTIYEDRVNKQLADIHNGAHATGIGGESIDMRTGALTLRHVDIDLPGNSALPVRLVRGFKTPRADGAFNDWDIELPHLSGIFALAVGWQIDDVASPNKRCSAAIGRSVVVPPYAMADLPAGYDNVGFYPEEYWHGYQFEPPGGGSTPLLLRPSASPRKPTDGRTYPWVASGDWMFYCVALPGSTTNEGFAGVSPEGVTYLFDVMVSSPAQTISKYDDLLETTVVMRRKKVQLLPSKATDRFGNWVSYSYSTIHPGRVSRMEANDGRRIDIAYDARGRVQSATAAGRTWSYAYEGNAAVTTSNDLVLRSVTRPDSSQWTFDLNALGVAHVYLKSCAPIGSIDYEWGCDPEEMKNPNQLYTGVVWAPSGLRTDYQFKAVRPIQSADSDNMGSPRPGLVQKSVSGPGVATAIWTYAYSHVPTAVWANGCGGPCPTSVESSFVDPSGHRHRFVHGVDQTSRNHGLLLSSSITPVGSATPLETTTYAYNLATTGQAFAPAIGSDPLGHYSINVTLPGAVRPLSGTVITRDGATFSSVTDASDFDEFARPLSATKSSSLGYSRTDATAYHDNLTKWVLGQVKQTSTNGIVTSETSYDPVTALPVWNKAFGKLQQTLGHNADGTVATVKDGRNLVTTLATWKRGIPQKITYPDGKFESAVVNDDGTIASVTDENGAGFTTSYGYDAMGRLTSINYPDDAGQPYNNTIITFAPSPTAGYGLPAGHWKQTTTTGNARIDTHFDALWRPLVKSTYDTLDFNDTLSQSVIRYDAEGRPTFNSYPQRTTNSAIYNTWGNPALAPNALGVDTQYDALGRVTRTTADSELGALQTVTEYLPGFQTRVTNPRGKQTLTTMYQAYDQPTYDWPRGINHPEGAYTEIYRDPSFGKPTAVRRRNADASQAAWRYYAYDTHQRLCRTTEPETGATLMGYDAANNLAWSATGLPASTPCDPEGDTATILGRRAVRSYDARNRITALTFPDGKSDTTYAYTPDGLLASVVALNGGSNPVTTEYSYNKRRLMTTERLVWDIINWPVSYTYNANGHLASQVWHGMNVTYAPNALGQATQAGTYATGVSYFPNGAIKQFTYGNGIVHTLTQNTRQLPDTSRDAYGTAEVLDDGYDYDQNANVAAISDGLAGARGHRTMTYDDLDRLKTTVSPMYGAAGATYTYDVLDNLKTVKAPGRNHSYGYDTANRLTNIKDATTGATVIGLGYDVQGNLENRNGRDLDFDMGNRLRSAEAAGASPASSYVYDGQGRRVRDTTSTWKYSQYNHAGQLALTSDDRTKDVVDYVYLGGSLVALRERHVPTNTYTTKYQHTDALGSPVAVTNPSRQVIERSEYEPYGERLSSSTPASKDGVGYTGHVEDAATGLTYMQQRYYDPGIGRFLSVDPVTADGNTGGNFNRYWYANNNPYRFTDPDGRQSVGEMIDSAATGCGPVSCAGWAALNATWKVFGSEGISQIADKGWSNVSNGDRAGAVLEAASVLAPVKILGEGAPIAKEITLSIKSHGEAAAHAADAIKAGKPDVLTIARPGAPANRSAAIGGVDKVPGKQLDEYPPAMFQEGGSGASVRAINPSDNMSAGACIGNACRGLENGERIRIRIEE